MSALARLRNLFLPVSIGLLILLVAGLYNLVWLPSQHKYLDNRNFRLLPTLNEQISISINTFDMMLDNAADSGVPGNDTDNDDDTDTNLSFYLKQVAPHRSTHPAIAPYLHPRRNGIASYPRSRPSGGPTVRKSR